MDPAEAARRIEKYLRTFDPRDLWPDVTERGFFEAMGEITRIATGLLANESRVTIGDPMPGGTAAFGAATGASGMGPLLGYWVTSGRLDVPPNVALLLGQHLEHGRQRAQRLADAMEQVLGLLEDVGVTGVVLKGMHTGRVYFPEPGCRPCGDIDLLIPAESVPDAGRALAAHGFVQEAAVPGRTTWAPAGAGSVVSIDFHSADNPWTLDLHSTLDRQFPGAASVVGFGPVGERDTQPWGAGNARTNVLAQPLLTGFLALHATSHFPGVHLIGLVELVLVIRRDLGRTLAWDAFLERLNAAAPFAYPALDLAERLVPGTVDAEVLGGLRARVPERVRRLVERTALAATQQLYRRSVESMFLWTPTRRQRMTSFLTWLWPRDHDGARLPARDAGRVIGRRIRRLLTGRFSWRQR